MEASALSLDLQNECSDFQPRSLEGARHGPCDVLVTIGSEGDQGRSGSGESHCRGTCLSGRGHGCFSSGNESQALILVESIRHRHLQEIEVTAAKRFHGEKSSS